MSSPLRQRWWVRLRGASLRGRLRGRGGAWRLAAVALLLAAALANPRFPMQRQLYEHLVVLDITQSMDVQDQQLDGRPASRLQAAKRALHGALLALPCGSRVGWAVFTEHRSFVLFNPVEVCEHLGELRDSLAHIDGRMAWLGNSEIAKGLHATLRQAAKTPRKPSVLFITDGHESPPLDPKQRPSFGGEPGEVAGLIVGVGGLVAQPIPRSDPMGRPLGVWAADQVAQVDPFSQGRGGSVSGETMSDGRTAAATAPGATPGSEHLSSLREGYLRLLAGETGLAYTAFSGEASMAAALTHPALARPVPSQAPLRPWLAGTALLVLLAHVLGAGLGRLRQGRMPGFRRLPFAPGTSR